MKISAAVVPSRGQPFEIQELDLSGPAAGEVLIRVVASGMCQTDLHARDGYFPNLPYPVVPGHEGAGVIEAVGAGVTDLNAAMRWSCRFRGAGSAGRAGTIIRPIARMRGR
jgi:Zn-dependent alcohol dehydrogenase